jgi:hypothetical protein
MAIRVQCDQCEGTISVDEAFAGSVCRCPYCKAMVVVPVSDGQAGQARRPAAPGARPTAPPSAARPVQPPPESPPPRQPAERKLGEAELRRQAHARKQRTILVIMALLVTIALVGVAVILWPESTSEAEDAAEQPVGPDDDPDRPAPTVTGPNLARRIALESPVVYVLDAGGSMQPHIGVAAQAATESIVSLGQDGKFNLLIVSEEQITSLGEKPRAAGPNGAQAASDVLDGVFASGATSARLIEAIGQAVESRPADVVVFTAKPLEDLDALIRKAVQAGVEIHVASLVEDRYVNESLRKLASGTGGKFVGLWD